jgi:hypothetical protein
VNKQVIWFGFDRLRRAALYVNADFPQALCLAFIRKLTAMIAE